MRIHTTPKFFVFHFGDWYGRGPAAVRYSREQWSRTAARYGWGESSVPTDLVDYCGGKVQLAEVLHPALEPDLVVYQ